MEFLRLVRDKNPHDPPMSSAGAFVHCAGKTGLQKSLQYSVRTFPGKMVYVVDGLPPGTEGFSQLGDPAPDEVEAWEAVRSAGGPVSFEDTSPQWGELMSVYVPIRDASGNIVGIFGADHEMNTVLAAVAGRARFFAGMILLVTLVGIGAGMRDSFWWGVPMRAGQHAHVRPLDRAY
jgi:hypothetical protein